MFGRFDKKRRAILFACCLVTLIGAVGIITTVKINSQRLQNDNQKEKNELIKKIEKSPDYSLQVFENDDSPLRIIETKVKEITGSEFTRLTGKTTDLAAVSSFPEIKLHNTSGKTITKFALLIRDPKTQTSETLNQGNVSIASGAAYTIKREHFIDPVERTVSDDKAARRESIPPKMDSEKYWIDFAGRSDIFVTVGMVYFEDGSKWMIRESGEIK